MATSDWFSEDDIPENDYSLFRDPDDPEPWKLKKEYSVGDIIKMDFSADKPLPFFTRDDVFWVSTSHLLAAPAKTGKSSIMRKAAQSWCFDGHGILYFSEEFERVWKKQAVELDLDMEGTGTYSVVPAKGVPVSRLLKRAQDGPEDIIIIDTIQGLLKIKNLGNSDEVQYKLTDWLALCGEGKTVIFVHHMLTKASAKNFGAAIAGGYGLLGAVDTILQYKEMGDENIRLMEIRSRMLMDHISFVVRKVGSVFTIEEAPDELTLTDNEIMVWEALDPQNAQSIDELAEATDLTKPNVRVILRKLVSRGLAVDITGNSGRKPGRGKKAEYISTTVPDEDEDEEDGNDASAI